MGNRTAGLQEGRTLRTGKEGAVDASQKGGKEEKARRKKEVHRIAERRGPLSRGRRGGMGTGKENFRIGEALQPGLRKRSRNDGDPSLSKKKKRDIWGVSEGRKKKEEVAVQVEGKEGPRSEGK